MAARDRTPTSRRTETRVGRAGTPAQGRDLRARGRRTMRKLLDAGMTVFTTKGYHAARVDDIVKVAKTSHGTFYLYFANKEDLFNALVSDVADRLTELTETLQPITADEEGRAVLHAWIDEFSALYETYGAVIRTWTEAEAETTALGRMGTELLTRLAAALSAHITDPVPGVDPATAGLAVVAMVERVNYFAQSRQIEADRSALVATLTQITHAALFGPS